MDRFIKQKPSATIKVKNNIVYKIFNGGFFPACLTSEEWEKDYNNLRDINPHFVKILECNRTEKYISMPYIPVQPINETNFRTKHLYQTLQIIKDMMMFAEERNGFIHADLHCINLLMNTKTGNIIIIDPDSFLYKSPKITMPIWKYRTRYEFNETIHKLIKYWFLVS